MRALQLPGTQEDVKHWVLRAFENYKISKAVLLTLDNRIAYLNRLQGLDGEDGDLMLKCPERPDQSFWMCHFDPNILMCSLFDLCYDVLGPEATLRRDVEEEEGPEIPQVRRYPLMTALTISLDVIQGKMSLQDFGSKSQTFALYYSLFTRSVGVRLSRARDTKPEHQHTFATFLLHIMPGARFGDNLASMLHIMAYNPQFCDMMPSLVKPKKTRLIKQWKEKLAEMAQTVRKAEDTQKLVFPPYSDQFQDLPTVQQSVVAPEYFAMPPQGRGLCPRLLFTPEVPRIGAAVWGCPKLAGLGCEVRSLKESTTMSKEDIEAFSSNPLVKLMNEYLIEVEPSDLMDENMPFSLSAHPLSKHRVAVGMFEKLDREVKYCAQMWNKQKTRHLSSLTRHTIEKIVNGDEACLEAARKQVEELLAKLYAIKEADVKSTAASIHDVQSMGNDIDVSENRDRLRFWLLRYASLESHLWFEHMCCGLLSPTCEADWQEANPFLNSTMSSTILNRVSQMMLTANRIVQTCRVLDACWGLYKVLESPKSVGESKEALLSALIEKSNLASGWLSTKRTFIQPGENVFDPRFLIFEFVTSFVLRPRQVEMIQEFSVCIRKGESVVKQMIMVQERLRSYRHCLPSCLQMARDWCV
jgi:phosphopantetheinyl transferase (holo-ACP synthase)